MIVWIGSGVPMLKFDRFSKSAGVLLVSPLGVGGSLSQILFIFQKYDEFDIVSEPKVLPPPVFDQHLETHNIQKNCFI